jgi:outer membrane receptor protein involved in Fe transport
MLQTLQSRGCLCLVLLLSMSKLALGADANATASDSLAASKDKEDESRVTSQVASFAITKLKDSPAVVTVISSDDIRNSGARDLIDILYTVPGYFVGADVQGVVGPGFRGLWGHEGKILLMIDGKEMNDLLYSNMQLGNEFPIELIERVEVVRGPGSVIYGGSAELSVINVVTRGLQGATDVKVSASYGQMTEATDVAHGYARRNVSASARYVVDQVPGLSTFASVGVGQGQRSVRDFVDTSGTSATMAGQSALEPSVVQAGVGYRDIQATFLYHRWRDTSVYGYGTTLDAPVPLTFDAYHGELVATFHPTDRLEVVPRFNITYQKPWRAPPGDFFVDKSVRRVRGRLLSRWAPIDSLQITAGGDAVFDEANLLTPFTGELMGAQSPYNGGNRVSYQTFGGYLELYSENPIVNVSAGARYDHHSLVGGALVPRLVLSRSFGSLSLKALLSYSFRSPGVENISLGIDVRPERTRMFEFEGSLDLSPGQRLSANVFDAAISAPIAYVTVDGADAYTNLGKQGTRGVEASYRLRHELGRFEASYSFYAPSISDNTDPYAVPGHNDQFLAAPAHKAVFTGTLRPWRWLNISPTILVFGQRYMRGAPDLSGRETALSVPAQVLANLYIHVDDVATRGLSVGLGVYNAFGTSYQFVRPAAATDYANAAPLPGLDREVMLRLGYYWEASGE